jgi:hypothetical protein
MTAGARQVASWTKPAAGLAVVAGAAAWLLRARAPVLVDAPACPGLLEGVAAALVRSLPRTAVGDLLNWWSGLALVGAVALFVALCLRAGGSAAASVAAGVGLGVGVPVQWAPPHAQSAVGLALVLAWTAVSSSTPRVRVMTGAIVSAGVLAAIEPGMLVGAALAAAAVAWLSDGSAPRNRRVVAATAALGLAAVACWVTVALLAQAASPARVSGLPRCGLPAWGTARREAVALAASLWALGPFPLGLAVFGFAANVRRSPALLTMAAVLGLCVVPASIGAAEEAGAAGAVAAAAVWLLASAGLDAVASAAAVQGASRGVATAALAVWAALLPAARAHAPTGEPPHGRPGHEAVSLRRFQAITGAMPLGAALVEEDATTAVFVRAGEPERRAGGKTLVIVSRDADGWLRAGVDTKAVFALPLAQAHLADRGAVLEPVRTGGAAGPAGPGLARVSAILPCAGVGPAWSEVTTAFARNRAAFVAPERAARGPIVIFLASDRPFDVVASGWPVRARRGFHLRRFDRQQSRESAGLAEEAAAEGLDIRAFDAYRYAARLLVFRTPDAPQNLAFDVTAPVAKALARLQPASGGRSVSVCPSAEVAGPSDAGTSP